MTNLPLSADAITQQFIGRLDGGACVNQRSLARAFELFGAARRSSTLRDISLAELLDALWTLDLMIAHSHVSYDGTLPECDLRLMEKAATEFCKRTGWSRASVVALTPESDEKQLQMQVNSAFDMLDISAEPVRGLDMSLPEDDARRFFEALNALGLPSGKELGDNKDLREQLMFLGRAPFRGSKCVAAIVGQGDEAIRLAQNLRSQHADNPGLAASMLMNRFRFGYLRNLANEAGDTYVPGAVWRTFSAHNAQSIFEIYTRKLGDDYLDSIKTALGGSNGISTTLIPPVGLYCLMAAKSAHGPKGVVELASMIAKDYRAALCDLTKVAIDFEDDFQGWTQATGKSEVDALSLQIEKHLSDHLGVIDQQVARRRAGNPPGYDRYFTYFSKLIAIGAAGAAGALIEGPTGLLGPALGSATGYVIGDAIETRLIPVARRYFFGHVDAYRALDNYLTDPAVSKLHMPSLEAQVKDVLGLKLVP